MRLFFKPFSSNYLETGLPYFIYSEQQCCVVVQDRHTIKMIAHEKLLHFLFTFMRGEEKRERG